MQTFIKMENIPSELRESLTKATAKETPIGEKMEILFYFRSLNTPEAALCVQFCLSGVSVLLDHEVAYVLGQMKQDISVDFLISLATDNCVDDIVRHEAIEALGNFENTDLVPLLEPFLASERPILRESAVLAIEKLKSRGVADKSISRYGSRDPAYPFEGSFEDAANWLINGSLIQKYQAIFFFRDLNNDGAVDMLEKGFEDPSELLRHEVAYVFGQMRNPRSIKALSRVLKNEAEKDIVRHEAAEALGNIGTPECFEILENYKDSEIRILRESARVGLNIFENYN